MGLFYPRALLKRRYSAKETYNFKEPTNRCHPIARTRTPELKTPSGLPSNVVESGVRKHVELVNLRYRKHDVGNKTYAREGERGRESDRMCVRERGCM